MEEVVNAVEAILFLTPKPLSVKEIAKIVGVEEEDVIKAIEKLRERYVGTALEIEEFVDSFRLNVRNEYKDLAKKLGLLPEFTSKELKLIAELMKKGEIKQSELKKRYKDWARFLEKMKSYGFITLRREGKSIIVRKTKLLERYFSFTEGNG